MSQRTIIVKVEIAFPFFPGELDKNVSPLHAGMLKSPGALCTCFNSLRGPGYWDQIVLAVTR